MEKISAKLLVVGIDTTDSEVKDKTTANAAVWTEQPLTYREDELSISEDDPSEEEIFSHELDDAVDAEYTFSGINAVGTFIMPAVEQVKDLLGGSVDGTAYVMTSERALIDKPMRFRFKGGGWVVLPRAKGYALLNMNVGRGGVIRFPFKLKALAQTGVPSLIWETDKNAAVTFKPANYPAPTPAAATEPKTTK